MIRRIMNGSLRRHLPTQSSFSERSPPLMHDVNFDACTIEFRLPSLSLTLSILLSPSLSLSSQHSYLNRILGHSNFEMKTQTKTERNLRNKRREQNLPSPQSQRFHANAPVCGDLISTEGSRPSSTTNPDTKQTKKDKPII